MTRRSILVGVAALLAAASLAVSGCGSDSESADSSTSTPAATPQTVTVVMGAPEEFSLVATPAEVTAGEITFAVTNSGLILHEMVIVPSEEGPEALRQDSGEASEEGALGEVADLDPGKDGTLTVTLPAGKYVLLCNLPGHFAGGMYATLDVS